MADLKITGLDALAEASIQATDALAIADLSATETKKVTVKDLIAAGVALIDSGDIPAVKVATPLAADAVATVTIQNLAVTAAKIANGTITATQIADATITGTKLVNDTVTATQIAANAIGSSELADDAVDTAAIADLAVDNARIANTTIAYGKLNLADGDIPGAKIAAGGITSTQLATNSVTATELADNAVDANAIASGVITGAKIASTTIAAGNIVNNTITSTQLANNAVGTDQIANGAVTAAKLSGTIEAGTIANGAVTTAKLADDAVDSTKLAANAVDAAALANNAVDSGAIASNAVTEAKIASNAVTVTKIADGTITPAKLNTSNLDRSLNVAGGNLGINNTVTAATRSGISYNAQGLITGTVALAASDLPISSASAVGGVSVGTGLSVNGSGVLSLSNSVTGATVSGITFSNTGQITAATALVSSDLPVSTTSAKGAVKITSGGGLTVDVSGNLTTSTSGVSAGTYQSVTVNTKGVITAGAALTDALIPNISAAKITSGSLDAARIANDSIDSSKLSNSSTTIIQSIAQNGYPTAAFTGQLLFDPIAEDAYLWDGNAWNPITTLTKGALQRFGTYNASTSKVDYVTAAGAAAGLTVGSNLPVASESVDGGYVVISVQGTPSGIAGITGQLSPPDYLLGVTASASSSSWVEIDLSTTVASQQASAISYTPYGQLAATNVQAVINELEDEKLSLAGGTITGQVLIGNAGSLVFEGSTADAFETTLTVADPTTSDKTITLPNVTGTVITTGDTGTVTGTMLANGTIQNVDIHADAAIAFTKLADLTSAQILVGNGSNEPTAVAVTGDIGINNAGLTSITAGAIVNADISNSAAITGSKVTTGTTSAVGVLQLTDSATSTSATTAATPAAVKIAKDAADAAATTANAALPSTGGTITNNVLVSNAKSLRLGELTSNGGNWVGLRAPDSLTTDTTFTLMSGLGSANQIIKTDASGNLSFTNDIPGSSASCTGNAATATTLTTARAINGVNFDGSADITVTAAAGTLTGATLNSGVTASSLTSVGTLTGLAVTASTKTLEVDSAGTKVSGNSGVGSLHIGNGGLTISTTSFNHTSFVPGGDITFNFSGGTGKFLMMGAGGKTVARFTREQAELWAVTGGGSGHKVIANTNTTGFNIYEQLQLSDSDGSHHVGFVAPSTVASNLIWTLPAADGSANQVLKTDGSGALGWSSISSNSATATALQTARAINGVNFDGTADITVTAAAGTLTGTTLKSTVVTSSLTTVGTLGSLAVTNNVTIGGDLTVNGTTTSVNSTQLDVTDKNITMGNVSSPSDTTADGGGLTLKGSSDKTFNWVNSTDAWTSSEHIQVASGKTFIGDGSTLTALNASNIASGTIAAARVPTLNQNTTGTAASVTGAAQTAITSLGTLTGLTVDGDVTLTGAANNVVWDKSDNALEFADSAKAVFGSDSDLKIFHNGTKNWIEAHNGDIGIAVVNGNEHSADFVSNGGVLLYFNGQKTFETTANGVTIYDDGKNDEARLIVQGGEGNGATIFLHADDGDNDADQWRIGADTSGNFKVANYSTGSWVDGLTLDGSNNATFAGDIDLSDSKKIKLGGGDDLQCFHDGTDSYLTNGTGELRILNIANTNLKLYTNNNPRLTIANDGHATFSNSVSDDKGNLRSIPYVAKTSQYQLVASDAGKAISSSSGGWIIPNNAMSAGDAVTLINVTNGDLAIEEESGLNMYFANDGTTGDRVLAKRGIATVYFLSGGGASITGAGLS